MRSYDVVIVGAGAAGLMAAGTAGAAGYRTLLIEKMEKPARKIRITGKGRCNLTNTRPIAEFVEKVRANRPLAKRALNHFTNLQTIAFFEENGLKLVTERGGRVYPESGKAWDVADCLVRWAEKQGAEIECCTSAGNIEVHNDAVTAITVHHRDRGRETILTRNVIVTTGGLSYPATGSTGDGYRIARQAGHHIVDTRPSLVPLEYDRNKYPNLSGIELRNIKATLFVNRQAVAEEFGEMDFTENRGMGGAVVLRLSREAVDGLRSRKAVEISIDLKPSLTPEQLLSRFERELSGFPAPATVKDLLRKVLPKPLIASVARSAGVRTRSAAKELTAEDKKWIVRVLKDFRIAVTGHRPYEEAVVTAGGVDTDQIDPSTLESTLIHGLYFAGEVLDIDADTGGYNLQLAFSTGKLAGELRK